MGENDQSQTWRPSPPTTLMWEQGVSKSASDGRDSMSFSHPSSAFSLFLGSKIMRSFEDLFPTGIHKTKLKLVPQNFFDLLFERNKINQINRLIARWFFSLIHPKVLQW